MNQLDKTFRITPSIDPTVVGMPMQIRDFSRTLASHSKLYHHQNESGRYDDDIIFPTYRMESKSKLTDLVSNLPLGEPLMISLKCLSVFQSMNLPDYQIFPIEFIHKGDLVRNYVAFSIVKSPEFLKLISWDNSKFYKTENFHRNRVSEHRFTSIEQLMSSKKEYADMGFGLWADIRIRYHNDFDIVNFGWYPLNLGYLCSEEAKDQIVAAKLTGFEFEELPHEMFLR